MLIVVCCSTCRTDMIPFIELCFEKQTHTNKLLVVESRNDFLSLGAKRNVCAQRALDAGADAIVVWDDDDAYFPWALEATNKALEKAEWSRPSQFCWLNNGQLVPAKTYGRKDKRDKAFQCAWGIRADTFYKHGWYPYLSVGEDMQLAMKLEKAGVTECDPIEEFGYRPWYVWGPWKNRHVSDERFTFNEGVLRDGKPLGLDLDNPVYKDCLLERGFKQQDWYEDVTR